MLEECFSQARGGAVKKRGVLITDGKAVDASALQEQVDRANAEGCACCDIQSQFNDIH